jgi:cystathionine gamma-lyase
MPPIYATSTYAQSSPGVHQGYEYSRTQNPTRFAYERCVAALEGGSRGFAFASGMAATSTVLELLDSGSHVVAMDDVYGGTYRLFERVRRRSAGLDFSFVDLTDPAAFEAAIRPETRMVWIETPTNPMLKIVDLRSARSPASAASWRWLTTPSPRRSCSARLSTAPTSSSTRRPNTSAATPTSSAA